jgi:hypothetical protein
VSVAREFDPQSLVGLRFPDGSYTITEEANAAFCRIVNAPELPPGRAHPLFGHLATHVGKGLTFAEFAELVGSRFDAGFLFGGGSLVYSRPLEVGRPYVVRGGITAVESRVGRRTGPFDVITTTLDLVDPETDEVVSTSVERYICPRS